MVRLQLAFDDYSDNSTPEEVSIPLWFDYNYIQTKKLNGFTHESLNSTMVRLQLRESEFNSKLFLFVSQFHYGSITTNQ